MKSNTELSIAQRNLHNLLKNVRAIGASTLIVITVLLFGPLFEGHFFPVLTNMEGTYVKTQDKKMFFQLTSNQLRACNLVDVRALVDKDKFDTVEPVKGAIWSSEHQFGTPVLGKQDMGVWIVVPEGDKVIVDASWQCHSFWQTRQFIGVWERPINPTK